MARGSRGVSPLWDAIVRKESANFSMLVLSSWTLALIISFAAPWILRTRLSATMRTTVAANLLLAAVGFAVNDSGPVVVALALFYLGPLLAMLRAEQPPLAITAARAPALAVGRRRAWPASAGR